MMKDLYKRYHADINFAHMGASAFVEDSREMNAGLDIKDALLVQRMSYWRIRGKHGPIDNCSKRRGRKNYLHLVRKHKRLAQQNNFRVSDVYGGCAVELGRLPAARTLGSGENARADQVSGCQ
jgi:hypothetical protein